MAEDKKEEYDKEYFDSPNTKEMRHIAGMNDYGKYANKDYPGRDTKQISAIKEEFKTNPQYRKYINANGNYMRHQAGLNVYRKYSHLRYSKDPLIQQHYKNNVAKANDRLAKESLKVHQLKKQSELDVPSNTNTHEAIDTMSMATGKLNLGERPTDNLKSGNNVNSDIFKNKWDKNEW